MLVDGQGQAPTTATDTTTPADEADVTRDIIAKLRQENAQLRADGKANAQAAKDLQALKTSQQTEAEKTAARISALEAQLASQATQVTRARVAAKYGIAPEDADLLLTGADEDTMTAQAERLTHISTTSHPSAPVQGPPPKPVKKTGQEPLRDVARQLFQRD